MPCWERGADLHHFRAGKAPERAAGAESGAALHENGADLHLFKPENGATLHHDSSYKNLKPIRESAYAQSHTSDSCFSVDNSGFEETRELCIDGSEAECGIGPDGSNGAASRGTAMASNGNVGPAPGIIRKSRSALSAGWNAETIRGLKAKLAQKAERERELAESADLISARLAAMGASPRDVAERWCLLPAADGDALADAQRDGTLTDAKLRRVFGLAPPPDRRPSKGDGIRARREALGIGVAEMAADLGFDDPANLAAIEAGRDPGPGLARRIRAYLAGHEAAATAPPVLSSSHGFP